MMTHDPISKWMTAMPYTLDEGESVARAEEIFRSHRIRHLPVLREARLAGVLSERDMFVAAQFAQTRGLSVGVIMAPEPITARPDALLRDVAEKLWVEREGVAIIVEDGRVLGVFTAVDALRALADRNVAAPEARAAAEIRPT